jgi:hypothetical protein
MAQTEEQHRGRLVRTRSILVIAAVAALGVGLLTAPASAIVTAPAPSDPSLNSAPVATPVSTSATDPTTKDTTAVITDNQIASSGSAQGTPVAVSPAAEVARAQAGGVDASGLAAIANATTCWYWDTQVYYKNLIGQVILRFHVEPNWCTTGYWLVSPVYTNTWANVNAPGWDFKHTGGWTRYGAGWNLYITHQDGHFCFVAYFNCVQNKYPWIEDEVGPGSHTDYMHWSS